MGWLNTAGGSLMCHCSSVGADGPWGYWGLMRSWNDQTSPKLAAFQYFAAELGQKIGA